MRIRIRIRKKQIIFLDLVDQFTNMKINETWQKRKEKACNIRDDTMKIQMNRMLIDFLLAFVC